jgi:nucleoside-diphosphate-sugar epimerase
MHEKDGLPLCILRPGVVIGEGGLPFHSGLGVFVRDRHCIGWNQGDNALPFVLAEDVASAIHHAIDAEGVVGRCYNIVGDVRFTAREYTAELARVLGRPLVFHPRPVVWLQLVEIGKWLIKLAIGRSENPFPSYRDLASRGMKARFDCSDAKSDLNWTPVNDRREAVGRGIEVYGEPK